MRILNFFCVEIIPLPGGKQAICGHGKEAD